jgi:cell wall-associated NlpC family hydrolase
MPFSPWPVPDFRPVRRLVGVTLLAVLGTAASPGAWSSPAETSDPVTRFLADKGLLGGQPPAPAGTPAKDAAPAKPDDTAKSPGLVQQVRDRASDMVLTAMNFLGVPYKRGGSSEDTGFDCSGFTRHIFEMSVGLILPRRADEQAKASSLVSIGREELRPGDLVFFNTLRRTFSHVGIYVGEGKFIHAPRSGAEVRVEDMRQAYWTKRFTGARRAPQVGAAEAKPVAAPVAPAPTAAPAAALGYQPNATAPAAAAIYTN